MNAQDFQNFVVEALKEIKEHLKLLNGRTVECGKEVAELRVRVKTTEQELKERRAFGRAAFLRFSAALVVAILGFLLGKLVR